jgi:hypothetical protein
VEPATGRKTPFLSVGMLLPIHVAAGGKRGQS